MNFKVLSLNINETKTFNYHEPDRIAFNSTFFPIVCFKKSGPLCEQLYVFLASLLTCYFLFIFSLIIREGKSFIQNLVSPNVIYSFLLFNISAFALNKEITVFDDSVNWLCLLLMVSSISLLLFATFEFESGFLVSLLCFFLGIATFLYAYFALLLASTYPIAILGAIVLGLSLHLLVPLLLLCVTIASFSTLQRKHTGLWPSYSIGLLIPLITAIVWVFVWQNRIEKLKPPLPYLY